MDKSDFGIKLTWWSIALLMLVFISGLFVPLTGDAGKYAAISRNIFESGDWINLQIHHQAYDQKPHLIFWLGALFFHLFGMSAFVFKLPVLLFSVLGFYSTYRLGSMLYDRQTGRLAMLVLMSFEIWILFSNDIHTDILMASSIVFGLWQLFIFLNKKKTINFVFGFAGIGLAVLSKGPVALIVPFFAIGGHLLARGQYRELFHPRWLIGIPVLALFLLPTIIGIFRQLGTDGLHFYFWENNFGRMSGEYKGDNNDPFFYFHTALYILLPWSLWFFLALYLEGKNLLVTIRADRKNSNCMLFSGIVFFLLIISVAKSKAPHFLLAVSPLAAILTAGWLNRIYVEEKYSRLRAFLNFMILIFGPGFLVFAGITAFLFFPSPVLFWIIWGLLALLSTLVIFKTRQLTRFVLLSVIGISAINFSFNLVLFPGMFSYHSTIPACNTFNQLAGENEVLHTCNSIHRELFFYCKNPGYYFEETGQLSEVLEQPGTWLYMSEKAYCELSAKGIDFEAFFEFRHKSLTRQSIRFLNPKTRNRSLDKMYLVKIAKQE